MRAVATALVLSFALTGCALTSPSSPSAEAGVGIQGMVHGGQQPIAGAHVYLLAANTVGYGGAGIAGSATNASLSLLGSASNTTLDGSAGATGGDYFVTTSANGSFSIAGDYTCAAGQQLYLYALGGNPGAGVNSAAGLLAALGPCSSLSTSTYAWINEVSTIAAAYSFAGFASDALHVSSSATSLAQTGIANAFANASNLSSLATGVALAATPSGTGKVPQTTIDTLANILASCVNSAGPASTPCATLFANASSAGSTGTVPTDTATAAINIAHNPGVDVAALYGITPPALAFSPALTSQPNDLSLTIGFSGGALYNSLAIAIDGSGNVWVSTSGYILGYTNPTTYIVELSSSGSFLSPTTGFPESGTVNPGVYGLEIDQSGAIWTESGGMAYQRYTTSGSSVTSDFTIFTNGVGGLAVDGLGNAWFSTGYSTGSGGTIIGKATSTGVLITPRSLVDGSILGYSGGGAAGVATAAIDGLGNAWFGSSNNTVNKFSPAGAALSGTGFTPGGIDDPTSIAIDSANNVWTASLLNGTVNKLSNAGVNLSGSAGFTFPFAAQYPRTLVIDGASTVWAPGNKSGVGTELVQLSNAGTIISGANYLTGGQAPDGIAIDGSGNVWIANSPGSSSNNVTETIGIAAPVVTPLSQAVSLNAIASRP